MSTFMKQKPAGRFAHPNPYNYKGRLGYACLNTILRHQKPTIFCSRTCRIETIRQKGIDFVKELALQNVRDLSTLIEWNEAHGIKFMRMSSDIFPFAGHKDYGYSLDFAKSELESIGELAAKYKHRLTLHPGQFNQLGSPNPGVVENTIRDLSYHAEMLDLMKLPPDSIMIIHMGGVYGDKASAIARFEENYKNLTDAIKKRLVLENDELGYSVTDLLPVCQRLDIPLVLDWHHHDINPGEASETLLDLLPAINETWHRKGIKPKQHYSESRPGAVSAVERRAHSDRVMNLPPSSDDVDLMIEAKEKEQAVFQLYKLYDLYPVDDDVWIANKKTIPKPVKAKKRKKAIQVEAQDDTIVENTIVEEEDKEQVIVGMRTRSRSRKKTKNA